MQERHSVILVDNSVDTHKLAQDLQKGIYPEFHWLQTKAIGEFSQQRIERYIEDEERHDDKILTRNTAQSLKSMSSGERKKKLLHYLIHHHPEVLIVINPFDSLDIQSQHNLKTQFKNLSTTVSFIQVTNRISDILPFMTHFYRFDKDELKSFSNVKNLEAALALKEERFTKAVPPPLKSISIAQGKLVECKDINVSFDGKRVLQNINWIIQPREFWQLIGPNGSGKSTLLNLIIGDSHKGYGQDLTVFGHKKGGGESVWDLKKHIGYFSPSMVDRFRGYHTLEHMLISGLHDSVGLYIKPSENEKQKALQWLNYLGMKGLRETYFRDLSLGSKRLVMTARAMIKHPPLLILDEPTVGLDDASALLFVELVNSYATHSNSAVIYVSHRTEHGLQPRKTFHLIPDEMGSIGTIEK